MVPLPCAIPEYVITLPEVKSEVVSRRNLYVITSESSSDELFQVNTNVVFVTAVLTGESKDG